MRIGAQTALLLVDLQPDFMPGGALAVAGGDELVAPSNALLARGAFGTVVATQDWHPRDHVSFASQHGRRPFETIELYGATQTLWPDHCVQGTPGAALHPGLDLAPVNAVIRKGSDRLVDSYSAFRHNLDPEGQRPATGLAGYLRERELRSVVIAGLARDFCVLWSAEDAAAAGFEVAVVWDLTRPVDPASDDATRAALGRAGVTILTTADLS